MKGLFEQKVLYFSLGIFLLCYFRKKNRLPLSIYFYAALIPYNALIRNAFPLLDHILEILILLEAVKTVLKKRFVIAVDWYFLLYFGSMVLSIYLLLFRNGGVRDLIYNSEIRFMLGMLIISILIRNNLKEREEYIQVLRIFSVNAFILAAAGLINSWAQGYGWWQYRTNFILGINHYAIYLLIGIIIHIYLFWMDYKSKRHKILFLSKELIYTGVTGLACITTKSAAILMIAVFILLTLFVYRLRYFKLLKCSWYILFFCALISMGMSIFGNYNELLFFRQVLGLFGRGDTDLSRLQIWGEAWRSFQSYPIAGIGPDQFRAYVNGYNFISHNDFLKVLAETGAIGIFTFSLYLCDIWKRCFKFERHRDVLFLSSIFAAMLIFMLTHNYTIYAVFWIITFTIRNMYRLEMDRKYKGENRYGETA